MNPLKLIAQSCAITALILVTIGFAKLPKMAEPAIIALASLSLLACVMNVLWQFGKDP